MGKTSLINAFVNNFCPRVYTETEDVTFYCKTLDVPEKMLPRTEKTAPQKLVPVLAEIEDTYAWGRAVEDSNKLVMLGGQGGPTPRTPRRMPQGSVAEASKFTQRRMGFIVLFDAANDQSFVHAKEALFNLMRESENCAPQAAPVLYLVAGKADKGELSRTFQAAKQFAEELRPRVVFEQISATEMQKVRKLFRKVLADVHATGRGSAAVGGRPAGPVLPLRPQPKALQLEQSNAKECVLQ